jgi:methionine S-methyltransferase
MTDLQQLPTRFVKAHNLVSVRHTNDQPMIPLSGPDTIDRLKLLLSGGDSVDRLKLLLSALENRSNNQEAIRVLHDFAQLLSTGSTASSLWIENMGLPDGQQLSLLLHEAVFPPENWGQTLADALVTLRDQFAGRRLAELGVGCGWISLLLLKLTLAREIVGLDINPIAVLIARLNAWLNGTGRDGSWRLTAGGLPLPDAFQTGVSDLLCQPISGSEKFDHIIGCIPQVLHPNPDVLERLADQPSSKDLYDLSNYCFPQGIEEDRFGLPLIAQALDQSAVCLTEGGTVTFVLGGRPGQEPIEAMFRRRGFNPKLIASRRVKQASDTDVASLVALERRHGVGFRFFLSPTAKEPNTATSVINLIASGEPVYHELFVYQASLAPRAEYLVSEAAPLPSTAALDFSVN